MKRIEVCRHTVPGSKALRGLRIGFVTDIHVASYRKPETLAPLFSAIAQLAPDLLLWGGDYAESPEYQQAFFRMAASLKPRLGMVGVIGNNDKECYGRSFAQMRHLAQRAGIRLLINEERRIDVGGSNICIAGLDEWKHGNPNAKGLFRRVPEDAFRILLTHYPHTADTFFAQADKPPHLVLSGHTHGGQIQFLGRTCYNFGYGKDYAKTAKRFFISGYRTLDEEYRGEPFAVRMLVSNGVGESLLPIRLFCPRQIHLITIE